MKTIWKIYDKDKKKILTVKSYRSKKEAEEGKQNIYSCKKGIKGITRFRNNRSRIYCE